MDSKLQDLLVRLGSISGKSIPTLGLIPSAVLVLLYLKNDEVNVQPVLGMSNSISPILKSDGYIEIPSDVSGLYAGADVQVFLY